MKLLLDFLVIAALLHVSIAAEINRFTRYNKERLNREPPLDTSAFSTYDDVEIKWIEQRLNNFDPQDERVWNMRYMENSLYLEDGGPIFIYSKKF